MSSSEHRARLAELAEYQIDCARQLLGILSREKDALDTRATDSILELASEKEQIATRLEELVTEARELSSRHGHDEDLEAYPMDDATSLARPDELRALMQACHHQNLVNGSVIEIRRRFTEQLLSSIRGTSSHETLYGPQGKPLRLTGTDALSKA